MTCLNVTQPANCTARIKTDVSDRGEPRSLILMNTLIELLLGVRDEQERRDPEMQGSAQYSDHSHSFLGVWGGDTHRKSATTEIRPNGTE